MKKVQAGFTLIEIAIVLVIIGLLLGGVLKGQEMITNGKLKRAVNDFNGISAAYYSYLDRYAAFPGDDPNAATRWTTGDEVDGDGNGLVDTGAWNAVGADLETDQFWLQMRASGLVAGGTTVAGGAYARPLSSAGGVLGVQNDNYTLQGAVACMGPMDGKVAGILDTQLDDGDATTGSMQGNTAAVAATTVAYAIGTNSFICVQL